MIIAIKSKLFLIILALERMVEGLRLDWYKKKLKVSSIDLYFPIYISNPENLIMGENCAIAPFVHMWSGAPITIGESTIIASHVQISTSTHDYNHRPYRGKRIDLPVKIGRNVWIGSGAIVMPGVVIGDNAVIGAGSVVVADIPANSLAYGVPARVAKML